MCNKAGHRAAYCTMKQANAVEEHAEEKQEEIGSEWNVGCVEAVSVAAGSGRR